MHVVKRAAAICAVVCLLWARARAGEPAVPVETWLATLSDFVQTVGNRQSFTEGELRARDELIRRLEAAGYRRQKETLKEQWMSAPLPVIRKFGFTQGMTNLIAVKKAASARPALLIVSAHYDTAYGTVGAKDNGSGAALLLEMARAFFSTEPFKDTEIWFVFFAAEEKGEKGSGFCAMELTEEERERLLGVLNVDLITLDEGARDVALSVNTLGARTADGYRAGGEDAPASNRISLAFAKAFGEVVDAPESERGVTYLIPRHFDMGDHVPFHLIGVDAATVCFQGNEAAGGAWPEDMHTPQDVIKPFDLRRTDEAIRAIIKTVYGLAGDHEYGQP